MNGFLCIRGAEMTTLNASQLVVQPGYSGFFRVHSEMATVYNIIETDGDAVSKVNRIAQAIGSQMTIVHESVAQGYRAIVQVRDKHTDGIGSNKKEARFQACATFVGYLRAYIEDAVSRSDVVIRCSVCTYDVQSEEHFEVCAVDQLTLVDRPEKVWCDECKCMINPQGHAARCKPKRQIAQEYFKAKAESFEGAKFMGDAWWKLLVACVIRSLYGKVNTAAVAEYITAAWQSRLYDNLKGRVALLSEHSRADLFEADVWTDKRIRVMVALQFIEELVNKRGLSFEVRDLNKDFVPLMGLGLDDFDLLAEMRSCWAEMRDGEAKSLLILNM